MEAPKTIRKPKQKRSINTKEKILEAAFKLFCEKGYYKTTTNEIAKVADVSIGSLYSYFKDKDVIFLEILDRYNALFIKVHEESAQNIDAFKSDKKKWLRQFIKSMIKIHEASKELNQEIKILSFSMPAVAELSKKNHQLTRKITLDYLLQCQDELTIKDIEAASVIVYNMISSIVDYIVFEKSEISSARLIETTVDAVYKLFIE